MEKDTLVKIVNRTDWSVGYTIPEMHINRDFEPRMEKEITFEELNALYMMRGGKEIIENYLVIRSEEAIKELGMEVEPEYFYDTDDIKRMLTTASYDELLDCLDFAPEGVIETLKDMAVDLPCYDMQKRAAIERRTGLNITRAIEIKNTKYDGDDAASDEVEKPKRRVATTETTTTTDSGRRTTPKYTFNSTNNSDK